MWFNYQLFKDTVKRLGNTPSGLLAMSPPELAALRMLCHSQQQEEQAGQ